MHLASGVYEKKKPFRFLVNDEQGDATSERYARSAQMVVLVACRIYKDEKSYPEVTMPPSVKEAAEKFLSTRSNEDPEEFQKSLHRLLWSIFSQKGACRRAHSICSRLWCVHACAQLRTAEPLLASVAVRFPGSRLSGIMCCVSCCAALEVLKYSPVERRDEVKEVVEKCLSASATLV